MTKDSDAQRVVIIGAGHAGGTAAALLRQYCPEWSITLVGEEPVPPYQRPPLSKAWLKGEADADGLALKPSSFYVEQNITLLSGSRVVGIERGEQRVHVAGGASIPYDYLVIATGARAIPLRTPGADLRGIMSLRTAADAEALKAAICPGQSIAVVGAGYIGLEVAASCRSLGMNVTVLERETRVLARVACEALSSFFTDVHEKQGVHFELGSSVVAFEGERGQVTGVTLADGRTLPCSAVVVGVGAAPDEELAREAGLECDRGVLVDLDARTSDPKIFAIGDVTRRPMPIYNCMFRMESVPNALEQAKQAASAIAGRSRPSVEVPWQWSDQYDLKLQIAGYPFDADSIVVRGDPRQSRFAVFHLNGDLVQAVEAINAVPEFMTGRILIGNRKAIDRRKLADASVSMKEVCA